MIFWMMLILIILVFLLNILVLAKWLSERKERKTYRSQMNKV